MSQSAPTASPAARAATSSALLVVLVLLALLAVVIIGLSFSTNNTPSSIDGTTATTSQFVEGD